jgi:LacI family transcriptional regulator
MSSPDRTFERIAVAASFSNAAGRDYLTGIFRYVNTGRRWTLEVFESCAALRERLDAGWHPDGILFVLPLEDRDLDALLEAGIPSVFVDIPASPKQFAGHRASFVRLDDSAIGRAAADHLLSRGRFNSLACVIDQPQFPYTEHREWGFRSRLGEDGLSAETIVIPEAASDETQFEAIRREISRLPAPAGVFAVRDRAAVAVLETCRRFDIDVPEKIAVLGVDNDEVLCRSSLVPLSSVLPDHEQLGFLAAEELRRVMRGGNSREIVFERSVKEVVLRDSTRLVPPAARIIATALSYIEANASGRLRVSDVVVHLGISRRLADLRFREVHGGTIRGEITRSRVKALKMRLAASRESLAHMADEFGFSSSAALVRYFKTATGETPGAWRRRNAREG